MKEDSKRVFGIAYLKTTISAIITIFTLLVSLIEYAVLGNQLGAFLIAESVWFVFVAATIFVLYRINKKQNQGIASLFKDNTVRKSVGVLILISGLMSLSVYIDAIQSIVTLICQGKADPTILLTIIDAIVIVCTILAGIYLLKYKDKTGEGYSAEIVLGVAYLYTMISTALSLVTKLSGTIISSYKINAYYFVWFAFAVVILFVLYRLNKKQNQDFVSVYQNDIIRKSVGALILIGGIISLSNYFNVARNIVSLMSSGNGTPNNIHTSIVRNCINFVIDAFQILYGIYLLKKSKPGGEHITKIALGTIILLGFIVPVFIMVTNMMGKAVSGDRLTAYYSLGAILIAAIFFIFFRLSKEKK